MQREINLLLQMLLVSPYTASTQIWEGKKSPDFFKYQWPRAQKKKKKALDKISASLLPEEIGPGDGWVEHGGWGVSRPLTSTQKKEKAKENLHPEACSGQQETHHISDEVFAPSLSSSANWSHEIPVLLTLRYGNANHS